jgi:hypothetical protein
MKLSTALFSLFAVAGLAAPVYVADTEVLAKRCARLNGNCGKDTAYNIAERVAEVDDLVAAAVEKRCSKVNYAKDTAYTIVKHDFEEAFAI